MKRNESASTETEVRTSPRAKRSLGQNFLHSKKALHDMANIGDAKAGELVLEIGPGKGALTEILLHKGLRLIAIEKDHRMIPLLEERFAQELQRGALTLIEGDALSESIWTEVVAKHGIKEGNYRVIANIPYYITGALLRHFLEHGPRPSSLTFMVQKEVAQQIMARENKESILSLSVKIFGTPHYGGIVKRTAFSPQPNVDSAIIHIDNIGLHYFSDEATVPRYFELLHKGFQSKRKTLLNNLSRYFDKNKSDVEQLFASLRIDLRTRPEDVPIETWVALTRSMF